MPDRLIVLTSDGQFVDRARLRRSGPAGPPSIVWYDSELGEDIQLADDFEAFVAARRNPETFHSGQAQSWSPTTGRKRLGRHSRTLAQSRLSPPGIASTGRRGQTQSMRCRGDLPALSRSTRDGLPAVAGQLWSV